MYSPRSPEHMFLSIAHVLTGMIRRTPNISLSFPYSSKKSLPVAVNLLSRTNETVHLTSNLCLIEPDTFLFPRFPTNDHYTPVMTMQTTETPLSLSFLLHMSTVRYVCGLSGVFAASPACSRPLQRVRGLSGVFAASPACSRPLQRVHGLSGAFMCSYLPPASF